MLMCGYSELVSLLMNVTLISSHKACGFDSSLENATIDRHMQGPILPMRRVSVMSVRRSSCGDVVSELNSSSLIKRMT